MRLKFFSLLRLMAWAVSGALFGGYIAGPLIAPMVRVSAERFDELTLAIAKGALITIVLSMLVLALVMLWGAVRNIVRS